MHDRGGDLGFRCLGLGGASLDSPVLGELIVMAVGFTSCRGICDLSLTDRSIRSRSVNHGSDRLVTSMSYVTGPQHVTLIANAAAPV